MSLIKIALLQMTACGNDQDANRAKGEAFCRQARELSADIALFPEMWNIGSLPLAGADPAHRPASWWRTRFAHHWG